MTNKSNIDNNKLLNEYDFALNGVLNSTTLLSAKKIASKALDISIEDYLIDDIYWEDNDDEIMELDFSDDSQEYHNNND